MTDAVSIALSGLRAQKQKLAATASNIANVTTTGALPSENPASTVYRPLQVNFQSVTHEGQGAGVKAHVSERPEGWTPVYAPDSPHANAQGLIAAPDVSLETEAVNLLMAKTAFKANIMALKTQEEMTKSLLDEIV